MEDADAQSPEPDPDGSEAGRSLYDVGDKFDSEAAAAKVGVRVRPVIAEVP